MGRFSSVQKARIGKTKLFFEDRKQFLFELHKDLAALERNSKKKKMIAAVRLNGLSDLSWEEIDSSIFKYDIQYWDYTKIKKRYINFLEGRLPSNYHLTFSQSEKNQNIIQDIMNKYTKYNFAVVFHNVPSTYNGLDVINGDEHDFRFLDKPNTIVGLKAKGYAKKDTSGFVI